MSDDLFSLDAVGQADAIRGGRVSALELTDAYLDRIDRANDVLRAYVALDAGDVDAPLGGVTFSIKDVDDVIGLPTTHSCEPLKDAIASEDGPIVPRFRAGGLVILGKTNVRENCTSFTSSRLDGVCRNPSDTDLTPGGSSGGAGAAVAAGLCAAAHGTDGAGSVRAPAAFCGLIGLKLTRGLIAYGPMEGSAYFGTSGPGVLTRSVRDAATLLDVMAPPGPWTARRPHGRRTRPLGRHGAGGDQRVRPSVGRLRRGRHVDRRVAAALGRLGAVGPLRRRAWRPLLAVPDAGAAVQHHRPTRDERPDGACLVSRTPCSG